MTTYKILSVPTYVHLFPRRSFQALSIHRRLLKRCNNLRTPFVYKRDACGEPIMACNLPPMESFTFRGAGRPPCVWMRERSATRRDAEPAAVRGRWRGGCGRLCCWPRPAPGHLRSRCWSIPHRYNSPAGTPTPFGTYTYSGGI